jgi:hypothetical protein
VPEEIVVLFCKKSTVNSIGNGIEGGIFESVKKIDNREMVRQG